MAKLIHRDDMNMYKSKFGGFQQVCCGYGYRDILQVNKF